MHNTFSKLFKSIWRRANVQTRNMSRQREVQEVSIPTSGGSIAGKWWGPTDKRPILTFHGWQDNAGSFDRLVPHLPLDIPILAIDSPGHGFSYRLPPGLAYHNIDSAIAIKQIKTLFGWDKLSLMGHSLGAIIAYQYGFLFPDEIDFIICIDGLHPLIPFKKMDRISKSIEEQIKYDALNSSEVEPPSYAVKEMEIRLHKATRKSINVEVAKHILYRNSAPSRKNPGKFYFNRDARLKAGPLSIPDPNELIRVAGNVTFPLHVTKAAKSPFFGQETIFQAVNDMLKKSSRNYVFREVPGAHHGHLNDPECVSSFICDFIRKHDSGNRANGGLRDEMKIDEGLYPMYEFKKQFFPD